MKTTITIDTDTHAVVPREPTGAMCIAARAVPELAEPYLSDFFLIWDAMIAAAPLIPKADILRANAMTQEQIDALIEFVRREIACAKDGPDGWVEEQRKKAEANLRALLTDPINGKED